jgi:hypothetical protein
MIRDVGSHGHVRAREPTPDDGIDIPASTSPAIRPLAAQVRVADVAARHSDLRSLVIVVKPMSSSSERCWYCGEQRALSSPEHVIPRALGGGLVIHVCEGCNARANRSVDEPLARVEDIVRERAELGLRDPRTNDRVSFSKTLETPEGLRLHATWSEDGIEARFLPVELPTRDSDVVDLFIDVRDAEEHSRKQAERAAKRGQRIEQPRSPPTWVENLKPRFAPGQEFTLLARGRGRPYPPWVWSAASAKVALACLCLGARRGFWPPSNIDKLTVHALRMLAFDHLYAPELWTPEEIWSVPQRPLPFDGLAGNLAREEHLFSIRAPGRHAEPPLAQLVLFGQWLIQLPLPGVSIPSSYAWVFSARSRGVVEGPVDDIIDLQRRARRRADQLHLF